MSAFCVILRTTTHKSTAEEMSKNVQQQIGPYHLNSLGGTVATKMELTISYWCFYVNLAPVKSKVMQHSDLRKIY
jgi:hypothetical protein